MSRMNRKMHNPMKRIKKHPRYKEYAQDAQKRINLGVTLYNFRKQRDMTQQQLAKAAATTQKVISNIENADMNVGWDLIMRILNVLGLSFKIIENENNGMQSINWNMVASLGGQLKKKWESEYNENIKTERVFQSRNEANQLTSTFRN